MTDNERQKMILTDLQWEGETRRILCLAGGKTIIEAEVLSEGQTGAQIGSIYAGRIEKIAGQIGAAFVRIGPDQTVYLPLESASDPVFIRRIRPDALSQNDELLVQIEKEEQKGKLAAATANLSIPGRYLVVTSQNRVIGFSKKLSRRKKEKLRNLLEELTEDASVIQERSEDVRVKQERSEDVRVKQERSEDVRVMKGEKAEADVCETERAFGIIVRTNAGNALEEDIRREYDCLSTQLKDLIRHAATRKCCTCVRREESPVMKRLRGIYEEQLSEILTDREDEAEQIREYVSRYSGFSDTAVRFYRDTYPLSAAYGLTEQLVRACRTKVWLKSGGFLFIEPTQALTAVDVNTGKSSSKKSRREHYLTINLEAAEEILRQLRLRNLSGMILIDFINMEHEKDWDLLMRTLRDAAVRDPVPVQVLDRTSLGLVEMTRKKTSKPLAEQLMKC